MSDRTPQGFSIFIGVIMIAAFVLTTGIALMTMSTRSLQSTRLLEARMQSGVALNACAEYALEQIRRTSGTLLSGSLSLESGTCFFDGTLISWNRIQIDVSALSDGAIRELLIVIDGFREDITLVSWEEV